MTRKEAIRIIKTMEINNRAVDNSVEASEEVANRFIALDMAIKALEQEPKTGHWEYGYAFADGNYCKCSECKEIIKCTYPMHYCPNCGARMVQPQEERNKE